MQHPRFRLGNIASLSSKTYAKLLMDLAFFAIGQRIVRALTISSDLATRALASAKDLL